VLSIAWPDGQNGSVPTPHPGNVGLFLLSCALFGTANALVDDSIAVIDVIAVTSNNIEIVFIAMGLNKLFHLIVFLHFSLLSTIIFIPLLFFVKSSKISLCSSLIHLILFYLLHL
jgi:hypothetical protein